MCDNATSPQWDAQPRGGELNQQLRGHCFGACQMQRLGLLPLLRKRVASLLPAAFECERLRLVPSRATCPWKLKGLLVWLHRLPKRARTTRKLPAGRPPTAASRQRRASRLRRPQHQQQG